jgi:hypothetical protein
MVRPAVGWTPLLAHAVAIALAGATAGAAAGAVPLVYAPAEAANAIHDGAPGVEGLTTALRQSPVYDDNRWPLDRRVGKVTGRQLAPLDAAGIAGALRDAWSQADAGGRVAIDEFVPGQWTDAGAERLAEAMRLLGPDAERVFVYASPALVAQVGRVDLRGGLSGRVASLFAATSAAGRAYLELYTGSLEPLPAREMATYVTRWSSRWPAGRGDRLHALIGPGGSTGQAEIWRRVRASPAGRAILANGPGAYGQPTREDGLAWLEAYRDFLRSPASPPPGGDTPVAAGGDIALALPPGTARVLPGARLTLRFTRGGRAIVRLIDRRGLRRVIASRTLPAGGGTVRATVPRLLPPGPYRLVVTLVGDGLTDELERPLRVGVSATVAARLTPAGWALLVRPSGATRLTGRLEVASAPGAFSRLRTLPARRLPAARRTAVPLGELSPGRYRAVVRLSGGPQVTRAFRVPA